VELKQAPPAGPCIACECTGHRRLRPSAAKGLQAPRNIAFTLLLQQFTLLRIGRISTVFQPMTKNFLILQQKNYFDCVLCQSCTPIWHDKCSLRIPYSPPALYTDRLAPKLNTCSSPCSPRSRIINNIRPTYLKLSEHLKIFLWFVQGYTELPFFVSFTFSHPPNGVTARSDSQIHLAWKQNVH
jgi:hypothetical protein